MKKTCADRSPSMASLYRVYSCHPLMQSVDHDLVMKKLRELIENMVKYIKN